MTNHILKQASEITKAAVTKAGEELRKHFGNVEAETKKNTGHSVSDIVTKLDRQTEDFLANELGKFDSTIGFHGEESGTRSAAKSMWLVDPIDGTSHFVRGLPFCTIMVALIEDHDVVMSVIYDFIHKYMYSAIKGQGAYKNNERLQVSTRPLSQALLSFETRIDNPDNLFLYRKVQKAANTIHVMTSGFEFAMVASGKLDGRLAKDPYGNDWDFAPGSLLVTEAGGIASNIGKATYDYHNHDYIITNPMIHRELTEGPYAIFPIEKT